MQSIKFKKDLKLEFKKVFPEPLGSFSIEYGQDLNHFIFEYKVVEIQYSGEEENEYLEGKIAYRKHKTRERNSKVIKEAKEQFKRNNNGRLFCEVCGFDFKMIYGNRGEDFIEGHHIKPVSELCEGDKTKVEDIALLCSNCHRMIHRKPFKSVKELSDIIKRNSL